MTGFDIAMAGLLSFGQVIPSGEREIVKHAGLQLVHADGAVTLRLTETGRSESAVDGGRLFTVKLKDEFYPVFVTRYVKTWNDCDAVETWYELRHDERGPVRLLRADSFAARVDCKADAVKVLTLTGVWGREANLSEATVANGQIAQYRSLAGTRDAWESNPAMMVSFRDNVDEERGKVLGVALEWTGTTEKRVRRSWNGDTTEVFIGVDMETGPYVLDPGKTFTTPKAILVWSEKGKGEVSRQYHRWARRHLMPHGDMLRPVLLNTWYGAYFNFTEKTLIDMMDGVKDMGAEMLVIDDGWFGNGKYARDDKNRDKTGLGDWVVNAEKLPHGLGWLADEAAKRGFQFGLWVEPEMCNTASWLAEAHPDWILREQNRTLLLGRGGSQATLDFTNPAVRDNIFAQLDAVYSSIPALAYIKWDCNQNIVNPGSTYLKPDRQANLWYDYTIGLYDLLAKFQAKRPHIMTQACASGGGHMDFGFLRYADEFWTSDITDPYRRIFIQWGSTQFYPAGAMACDVTKGGANLKYGLDVAMTGRLGISLHPKNLSAADVAFAKAAVADYKRIRPIVQCGDLYRLVSPYGGKMAALMYASEDNSGAALFALGLNKDIVAEKTLRLRGLDSDAKYVVTEINKGATLHAEQSAAPHTGRELMEKGIPVKLSGKFDSAVFEVRRVADATPSVRAVQKTSTVWLDEMDLSGMSCGWGKPQKNRSIVGKALRPGGTAFKRGVGSHAVSRYEIDCGGKALAFDAMVGVDAAAGKNLGSVKFIVDADGKRVAESSVMHAGTPPYRLHAELSGAKVVELYACDAYDGINYDHADWCDARFTVIDGASIGRTLAPKWPDMDLGAKKSDSKN